MEIPEDVPALLMWKSLSETIPIILNMESSETTLNRVTNILQSPDFTNMFVYNTDHSLSFEQFEAVWRRYKAFTVWLLGRFFYMLAQKKLSKIHDLLIVAQKRILHAVQFAQPLIYRELTTEYVVVLEKLNHYALNAYKGETSLEAFIPETLDDLKSSLELNPLFIQLSSEEACVHMQKVSLDFVAEFLIENMETCSVSQGVYRMLEIHRTILINFNLELKCAVLEIFAKLLMIDEEFPEAVLTCFKDMFSVFEQLTYRVFGKRLDAPTEDFRIIAAKIINTQKFDCRKMCEFILSQLLHEDIGSSPRVFDECLRIVDETYEFPCNSPKFFKLNVKRITNEILNYHKRHPEERFEKVDTVMSETWEKCYNLAFGNFDKKCENVCRLNDGLSDLKYLFETAVLVKVKVLNTTRNALEFFEETTVLPRYIDYVVGHIYNCSKHKLDMDLFTDVLTYIAIASNIKYSKPYLWILMSVGLLELCRPTDYDYQCWNYEDPKFKKNMNCLNISFLAMRTTEKYCFEKLCYFMKALYAFDILTVDFEEIHPIFVKLCKRYLRDTSPENFYIPLITNILPAMLSYTPDVDQVIKELLLPSTKYRSNPFAYIFPNLIMILSSDHRTLLDCEDMDNKPCIELLFFDNTEECDKLRENEFAVKLCQKKMMDVGETSEMFHLLRGTFEMLQRGDGLTRTNAIRCLPILSEHVPLFHHVKVQKWMTPLEDDDEEVRKIFSDVFYRTVKFVQENTSVTSAQRNQTIEALFIELKKSMKKSLQFNPEKQLTILMTIDNLRRLNGDELILPTMHLLLYFAMMPISDHKYFAVNAFNNLAKTRSTTTQKLYIRHRRDLCKTIVELCAINQALCDYGLIASLEPISTVFGCYGPKYFVVEETRFLLPFLVSLMFKMPDVAKLIDEVAGFNDVPLPELFASNYGEIFLHVYLNDYDEDNKKGLEYVEQTTRLDRSSLRKENFMTILSKLLLHFHNKHDRVIVALKHLAQENSEDKSTVSIPDFLQPRFLGILQHFDRNLAVAHCDKRMVLRSLARLFEFMGPRLISPLRFKIIAMLGTALHLNEGVHPSLNCDVWSAFIRSCDIEVLGPQLATIFVSILPLHKTNVEKIDEILKYLVVDNEMVLKDNIPDLFFVIGNDDLDRRMLNVITSHLERIREDKTFKEHIQYFLKYLNYETTEVRIHALKYIKDLLMKNRLELDQMVLGCNGIDSTIVELIDIVTLGCREQNPTLRLACGEVIGELGAIEPSHLPRTCTKNEYSFNFFMNEPGFIVTSLNELIRALQSEKNSQNMDRFSLAIQETLKIYEISPDVTSQRHELWNLFPESHQQLMTPLLSSKYTMAQGAEIIAKVSPIFGSNIAPTFQTWLYSWTASLVSTIKSSKKNILQFCLLSMKQDHKTLMHFFPYVFLHALSESSQIEQQQMYEEILAVLDEKKTSQQDYVINVQPFRAPNCTSIEQGTDGQETDKHERYTRTVFILLDFLDRWLREWLWDNSFSGRENDSYKKINMFLAHFCKLKLAKCNFKCGEYPRALMYLEDHMKSSKTESDENLSLLAEIYYRLDEPDGVAGVTVLRRHEPTLEQRILALEVSGKLFDVAACYERLGSPMNISQAQGLMKCYLDLDNVNTALKFAQSTMMAEYNDLMLELQAEPLWRLGRYDDLEELLKTPELKENHSWGVLIGRSLLDLKNGDRDTFKSHIAILKSMQVNSLGAASLEEGAYQHGYCYISRLHAISELEEVEKVVHELLLRPNDDSVCRYVIEKLKAEWDLRLKVVQQSMRIVEPILCLRRVAIEQAKNVVKTRVPSSIDLFNGVLGETWLRSAKIARTTEVHQQAFTYLIKAEEYSPNTLFLEKAKLHWIREEHEHALKTLKQGLEKILPEVSRVNRISPTNNLSIQQKKICSEAKLLIASYNDSISNVDTDMNILHYKEAIEMFRQWEKSLVCLAQYYDRLFQNYSDEDKDVKGSEMQIHMINYFGKSLQYGTSYVYQSLPRLLSIWFDYGTRMLEVSSSKVREERRHNLLKMTKLIDTFSERLPAFIFLTAFSQLVSRICHPQKEVYMTLKSVIIKLILKYPQQTMWMMIPVIKSSYPLRAKRGSEIFNDSKLKNTSMIKFLSDFAKFAEKLIELCNKEINETVTNVSVNMLQRALPRMLTKSDFSEIMMPTQMLRKLVLPNPDFSSSEHNPFPNHHVHIVGIEDDIVILPSLQRPRKITLRGSDGKKYIQMLKPKDDLRRDFRLMEFNDIVNQLLSREPESRQRRLNIRLYSVAPLNEECGLIEWVPDLVGLRPVLMTLYKQRGIGMKSKELKEVCCKLTDSMETKRQVFLKKLLPKHPPVLGDWFRKTFPDAQGWLTARMAYTRTTGVISMVGYILGLGDRHGENILLDSTSGDTMHVDFNCLFNKGENFEWPERVPFRLTQNMVAAMGPLGVEGLFRKSCACTLRVLRTHTNTLMSIVTPFVYDPLVSWPRNGGGSTSNVNSERTNESAVDNIREIRCRLKGQVKTKSRSYSIPLSVEGQVNNLIEEAMSLDNLCQMYIGWGPYL